ncbi:hypothetical protein EVAR_74293_1 [Eumeta japonica]|uniref:Uncharacterized protein n=1 Tax=Eumeta variegata TaxID=151549 RepID=A0A4C1SFP2_EUMVA|nr:hypothetical protein EVAR_74293_1 [Eumeta japonica]
MGYPMNENRVDYHEKGRVDHQNSHSLKEIQQQKLLLQVRILGEYDISLIDLVHFYAAAKLVTIWHYHSRIKVEKQQSKNYSSERAKMCICEVKINNLESVTSKFALTMLQLQGMGPAPSPGTVALPSRYWTGRQLCVYSRIMRFNRSFFISPGDSDYVRDKTEKRPQLERRRYATPRRVSARHHACVHSTGPYFTSSPLASGAGFRARWNSPTKNGTDLRLGVLALLIIARLTVDE